MGICSKGCLTELAGVAALAGVCFAHLAPRVMGVSRGITHGS